MVEALTTKQTTPVADLSKIKGPLFESVKPYASYADRMEASREMNSSEWREQFEHQTVGELKTEDYSTLIVRRPETDASSIGYDHMLFPLPQNPRHIPERDLVIFNTKFDASKFITHVQDVMTLYAEGNDLAIGVLNTSPLDTGETIQSDSIDKQRLPQSMMFPHIKLTGYKNVELRKAEEDEINPDLINRPLQEEMDELVSVIARHLNLETSRYQSRPGLNVDITNKPEEFLKLYRAVYYSMFSVSIDAIGPASLELSGGGPMTRERLADWAEKGIVDKSQRISNKQAVRQLNAAIKRGDENPEQFGDDLAPRGIKGLNEKLLEYAKAYTQRLKEDPEKYPYIIFGPSFSVLFKCDFNTPIHDPNNITLSATIVPAELVPKGANTITGIVPREERRALTEPEKEKIRKANDEIYFRLERKYQENWVPGNFNYDKYFQMFEIENS